MHRLAILVALVAGVVCACGRAPEPTPNRWLVIGLDGADWKVIEHLWAQGRMPHLRALAERGSRARLQTDYGKSPVIWTTIATGVGARRHGIIDFVVPTPQGDVPVASNLRRVPALWNMLSTVGLRVGVVHWWASWPAEEVNGVVVSDRSTTRGLAERVYPPAREAEVDALAEAMDPATWGPLDGELGRRRDLLATALGEQLLGEDLDLVMVYLRSPDLVSHPYWRYFQPEKFAPLSPEELAEHADKIPAVYEAVDGAIGRLVAAAASRPTNVLVISDHGFKAARRDQSKAVWRVDALLEALGFQERRDGKVEMGRTRVYGHQSPDMRPVKMLRYALAGREPGGSVPPGRREAVRQELEAALARVRFADGAPAFRLRDANRDETRDGADLALLLTQRDRERLYLDGSELPGVIVGLERISGTHSAHTHGILVIAGPDVARGVEPERVSIFDVAPTVLWALGLPVADDFAGRVAEELFAPAFRDATPRRTVSSWGGRTTSGPRAAAGDDQLLEELRALGYLD